MIPLDQPGVSAAQIVLSDPSLFRQQCYLDGGWGSAAASTCSPIIFI